MKQMHIRTPKTPYKPIDSQKGCIVTLYRNPIATGVNDPNFGIYVIRELQNVVYDSEGTSIARQTGIIPTGSSFMRVFHDPYLKYVDVTEWRQTAFDMIDDIWTADFADVSRQSIIVPKPKSEIDWTFTWGTQSNSSTQISNFLNFETTAMRLRAEPSDKRNGRIYTGFIELLSGR